MTPDLTLTPVRVGTGTEDEDGRLVFAGDRLVAVLVRLAEEHDEAGHWFLEHGFGKLDVPVPPTFSDLQAAETWLLARLNVWRTATPLWRCFQVRAPRRHNSSSPEAFDSLHNLVQCRTGEGCAREALMPSFFVDTSDGERFIRDEIGLEVESLQAARDEAMAALQAMSQNRPLDGDLREVFALVRDQSGRLLCQARMRIWCEWSD